MLAYKTFYACLAGVLTVGIGLLTAVLRAPAVWPVGASVLLAVLAWRVAVRVLHGAELFHAWSSKIKNATVGWIAVAAASHVAAVILLEVIGARWWAAWITAVAALVVVQIGTAHMLELHWFRLKPRPTKIDSTVTPSTDVAVRADGTIEPDHGREIVGQPRAWAQMSHDEKIMMLVLGEAGYDWLVLVGYEQIRDGEQVFGALFLVRVPAARLISEGADKAKLPASAAEPIAISLGEKLGVELESRFVSVRKRPAAGVYALTVVTQDVMGRLYPYRDPAIRQSIKKPALCGYGIDTRPVYLLLAQHGQHIGKSRSGKTSLIHVLLAFMTSCEGNGDNGDCVVWVCGTEKVYDLVGSWLECYMDTDEALPFDWVAHGPADTLNMLIALMTIARYRQSVPMHLRNWPTIILILDEASFALRNKSIIGLYDEQEVTMSDMAAMIGQGAGSGDCFLHNATQRDTNDQLGDKGGDLQAQAGFSSVFRIKDPATIGRIMGDYSLAQPVNQGEYWLDDGDGEDPQLVKAPYLQEIDPTKPRLHDQATIADVAWSRRHYPRVLDAGSARAAGEAYAARHTRMTQGFLAYLTGGNSIVSSESAATPTPRELFDHVISDAGRAEAEVEDRRPADVPVQPVTGPPPGAAATASRQRRDMLPVDVVIAMARDNGMQDAVEGLSRAEREGFVEAIQSEFGTVEEFDRFLADPQGYLKQDPAPAPPVQDAPMASASVPGKTRRARITAILSRTDTPLPSAEIITALRDGVDAVPSAEAVYNELSRMTQRGLLVKLDDGRYGLPDRTYEMAERAADGDSA